MPAVSPAALRLQDRGDLAVAGGDDSRDIQHSRAEMTRLRTAGT